MYRHPYIGDEIARQRQRDMIARAQQLSEARRAGARTGLTWLVAWAKRWIVGSFERRAPAVPAADAPPEPTRMTWSHPGTAPR
jgi:hypothetical protein